MNPNLWEYQLLVADARARVRKATQTGRLEAEKMLKRAIRLERRRPEALTVLGALYIKWGRWKMAV